MSIRTILLAAASVVCMAALGQKSITAQECWLDGNFAARQPATATVDISGLPVGLHSYSIRVQDSEGLWSSAVTKYFVIPSPIQPATNITACEYWIDSDMSTRATIGASPAQIDITDLTIGLHTFTIRTQDNNGVWSSPITKYFIKEKVVEPTTIARYMYWIDDDVANRVVGELTATGGTLLVTLPGTLADGTHTLSWCVGDNKGVWSDVRTETFNYIDPYVLQQDEEGNYLLGSVRDWQEFAELVKTTPNANAKMIADIDLGDDQTMIGSNNTYPYSGIFDGQGHTLTVAYNNTDAGLYVAPFSYIYGATIRNMHIAGTIQTACQNAGVVSKYAGSGNVMENVWCSLAIQTNWTVNGGIWECCSGLIGSTLAGSQARLTMNDCLFTGSVVATSGDQSGCFVGYIDMGCSANISNCLSLGTYSYTATNSSVDKYSMSIANSYIKQFPNAIPAAMQITDEQIASGVIAYKLQNNRADLVWGQRIGIDPEPVLTNDESYRVYISKNGGYTNDPEEAMLQDEEGYYLLGSVQDWKAFAALINSGITTANARMTADIDLGDDQTMIGLGSEDGRYGDGNLLYTGIFDGQGHTLTIHYVATERFVAPFRHIQDATIKNLHVTGTITTSNQFTGGIVGACYGENRDNYITNCISSVHIVSSWVNTEDTHINGSLIGGIVGKLCYYNRLHISDCIFNGSISGENRTVVWGGFVGLPDGTIIVRNSLLTAEFDCTNVLVGTNGAGTFSSVFGGGYASAIDIDASNYYLHALGAVQGTQANVNQLADGTTTTALQAGREEEIWVQEGEMPMLKLFASEITPVEPTGWENGVLPGKFSINANGDQVFFSQGNLQYQASTATWRFANNQYYFVGAGNANTSDTYDGWIDLFGWATNGLEANTATGKMPYYTGSNDVDYGPSIPSGEFDRSIYDWGMAIDGNWQTLSNEEWNYLFVGRANSNLLYGFGRLYGINGVIILPDDWDWNEAEIAEAATAAGFTWSGGAKTYSGNIISNKALWSTMESAGAVFLPAAGYRKGTINMAGSGGDYWSATASSATNAYRTSFYNDHLTLGNNWGRSDGLSVRLVQAVPTPGPGTSIDNANANAKATKVLRNGQILILRGEKLYTVDGRQVH